MGPENTRAAPMLGPPSVTLGERAPRDGGQMRTWIFQGNPDDFDIDGYLATRPVEFPWLATCYADDIAVGDRVYIWRTQGKRKADAGVIAEGVVIAPAALRPESPDAVPFWRTGSGEGTALLTRVTLRLVRIAGSREVIQRKWTRSFGACRT